MEQNDGKYLPELMAEKDSIDPSFEHAVRLISEGKEFGGFRYGLFLVYIYCMHLRILERFRYETCLTHIAEISIL